MSMIRKLVRSTVKALGDDLVEVRMSTAAVARDGHILTPQGARLDNYKLNPVFLWNHDVDCFPVGRSEGMHIDAEEIVTQVRFPPTGISARADECRGLVKAGFINGVSVGFDPLDGEPLDAKNPRGGQRVTDWELLECSFCCVPVDTEALVVARATTAEDWKCGASRDLPIDDSEGWDGSAAEESVFTWAGGDDFDPSKARKGFLAYNAAKPKERGSYKLPIAHIVDGRLKVPKGAIKAAASRLPQTDIPDGVKESARAVLDHYEEKAGMAEKDGDRSVKAKHTRALNRASKLKIVKRGLYEVANLAYMLENFGYVHACSEWEAEVEGDDSPVPGMLGEALVKMGEAFLAMTKEEVTELLSNKDLEIDESAIVIEERAWVQDGKTPAARAWRAGIAMTRAGKKLSATNEKKLGEADDAQTRALKHQGAVTGHHDDLKGNMDAITPALEKANKAHDEAGSALADAKSEPDKASEHVARAVKAHKQVGAALDDVQEQHDKMKDTHADAADANAAVGRHLKTAQRCVRAVTDGSSTDAEDTDGDSAKVQKSGGTAEDDGTESERSLTRRKEAISRLGAVRW